VEDRDTPVPPFYIQATEEANFQLDDGREVPVYSISIDSNDSTHAIAVFPAISELQVRLIETFMDTVRTHQPHARFKLSSHFPVGQLLNKPTGIFDIKGWLSYGTTSQARTALKALLSREEVILFASAHTHGRKIQDLTDKFQLARETPLMEVVVPSLTDYSPVEREGKPPHDGRALGIEKMLVRREQDKYSLDLELNFKGLEAEDLLKDCLGDEVRQAVAAHNEKHGYQRTLAIMLEKLGNPNWLGLRGPLGRQLIGNFFAKRIKNFLGFFSSGLWGFIPLNFFKRRYKAYWDRPSVLQDVSDALTVTSVEQMFQEAQDLIPFLDSLAHFVSQDVAAGDQTAEAVLAGLHQVQGNLVNEFAPYRNAFDAAVKERQDAAALTKFKDLFARIGLDQIPSLLLNLSYQSHARAFAVLVGLDASKVEYEFQGEKPAQVPNQALSLSVPLG
jgi:hypothetical protein